MELPNKITCTNCHKKTKSWFWGFNNGSENNREGFDVDFCSKKCLEKTVESQKLLESDDRNVITPCGLLYIKKGIKL